MATKCNGGAHCPYGYGHHDEHVRAAIKGWQTRRRKEGGFISRAFGGEEYGVTRHRGRYILQHGTDADLHYELTPGEFHQIIRTGRAEQRARQKQRQLDVIQETLTAANTRKGDAQGKRERRRWEREAELWQLEQERAQRRRDKEEALFHRESAHLRRDMLYEALRGRKIKPFETGNDKSLYNSVPRTYRTNDRHASTMDEIADELREEHPYLNIRSDGDLAEAFKEIGLMRKNERYRRQIAA